MTKLKELLNEEKEALRKAEKVNEDVFNIKLSRIREQVRKQVEETLVDLEAVLDFDPLEKDGKKREIASALKHLVESAVNAGEEAEKLKDEHDHTSTKRVDAVALAVLELNEWSENHK